MKKAMLAACAAFAVTAALFAAYLLWVASRDKKNRKVNRRDL